jgi:tripartite-type tricarboxylate transporter receptor subunit TctC
MFHINHVARRTMRPDEMAEFYRAVFEFARPTKAGVPAERVAALRDAFHAAMNDPAFIAQAVKDHLEIGEISGQRITQMLNDACAMPPDIAKAATEAMGNMPAGGD